jgi:hypothetical protein
MRKLLPFAFISLLISVTVQAQNFLLDPSLEGLFRFSRNYLRSNPFKNDFSGFINHLVNDPTITGKNIRKKTDTSLYSFAGVYTAYNPFFFKPKRVEIMLEEVSVQYTADSTKADTIFIYQLMAYTDNSPKAAEEIRKEFEKIHRQNRSRFFDNTYKETKNGTEITSAFHNYYLPAYLLSPASVIWGSAKEYNELFLNITVRFKRIGNAVVLPAPLNSL